MSSPNVNKNLIPIYCCSHTGLLKLRIYSTRFVEAPKLAVRVHLRRYIQVTRATNLQPPHGSAF